MMSINLFNVRFDFCSVYKQYLFKKAKLLNKEYVYFKKVLVFYNFLLIHTHTIIT